MLQPLRGKSKAKDPVSVSGIRNSWTKERKLIIFEDNFEPNKLLITDYEKIIDPVTGRCFVGRWMLR